MPASQDTARDIPRKPTILIADSNPTTRIHTAQSFERSGCTVIPAATIAEALTFLSRPWLAIDVVLCDVDLSDGPGETVVVVVRNTSRLGHIRVIMHAIGGVHRFGIGDDDARISGLMGYGANGYIRQSAVWDEVWASVFPE